MITTPIKKRLIKQTLNNTVLNMIADCILFFRISSAVQIAMNVTNPEHTQQNFIPYTEYKGFDNVFFLMKITEKSDPGYILRERLITSAMMDISLNAYDKPQHLAEFIYGRWLEIIQTTKN